MKKQIEKASKIMDWMKSNNLERVYFNDLLCDNTYDKDWIIKEIFFSDVGLNVYCFSPMDEKTDKYDFYEIKTERTKGWVSWSNPTLDMILDVLNNMTPEEIEEQKLKNKYE